LEREALLRNLFANGVAVSADILTSLRKIIDPELGVNIVDLGLVLRAAQSAAGIEVELIMTSSSCPLGEMLVSQADQALRDDFPDASSVRVELIRDVHWTPDRMSKEGRRQLLLD
jgi:metal-sulfur cluster biosynthetic enzyme